MYLRDLALAGDELCVSRLTKAELYLGAYRTSNPELEIERFAKVLAELPILELTEEIAQEYGRLTAKLTEKGLGIGDFDALIAATCIVQGEPILTANPKHFRKVEGLKVLTYL